MDTPLVHFKLLLTDIGYIFTICLFLSLGLFVLVKAPRQESNRIFFLFSLSAIIFLISHIVGINIQDSELSRAVFMGNMVTILTSVLTAHWMLALIGRLERQWNIIKTLYAIGFALIIFYLLFPDTFLLPSSPKLYFPNFYVQGPYYFLGDLYFYIILIYIFYHTAAAYLRADIILKNRIKYVVFGLLALYTLSVIPALLLYGIEVDPLISSLSGFCMIPIAYGLIKEELLDIHVIGKQALFYSGSVALAGIIIGGINFFNLFLVTSIPQFPSWLVPLISAIFVVEIARLIWRRLKELEDLKYEFINIVTHKFRTPLTYIKWSVEEIKRSEGDTSSALQNIEHAHGRLLELTNALVDVTSTEKVSYTYHHSRVDLSALIRKCAGGFSKRIGEKNLILAMEVPGHLYVLGDEERIETALQIILDNAVLYTRNGGKIEIRSVSSKKYEEILVRDTGIGIASRDIPRIFNKFYRSHEATLTDTEGVGLGLYIVKKIVDRHGGSVSVVSDGVGKGSTFTIKLPKAKN